MRPRGASTGAATVVVLAILGVLVGGCVGAATSAEDGLSFDKDSSDDGPGGAEVEAEGRGLGFFENIASAIQNAIGNKKPTAPPVGPQPTTTTEYPSSTTEYPSTTTSTTTSTTSSTTTTSSTSGANEIGCSSCPDSGYVFGPDSGSSSSSSSSSNSSSSSSNGTSSSSSSSNSSSSSSNGTSSSSNSSSSSSSSSSTGDEDPLGGVDWEDVFGPSNQAEVDAAQQANQ